MNRACPSSAAALASPLPIGRIRPALSLIDLFHELNHRGLAMSGFFLPVCERRACIALVLMLMNDVVRGGNTIGLSRGRRPKA